MRVRSFLEQNEPAGKTEKLQKDTNFLSFLSRLSCTKDIDIDDDVPFPTCTPVGLAGVPCRLNAG